MQSCECRSCYGFQPVVCATCALWSICSPPCTSLVVKHIIQINRDVADFKQMEQVIDCISRYQMLNFDLLLTNPSDRSKNNISDTLVNAFL